MFYDYPEIVERLDKEKRLKGKSGLVSPAKYVNTCIICGESFFSKFKTSNVCQKHTLV